MVSRRRSTRTDDERGSAFLEVAAAEQFGDLHRVQRRALAQIVADAPEVQAIFDRRVFTHARYERRKVAHAFDGGDIAAILALVVEHDAGSLAEDALRVL